MCDLNQVAQLNLESDCHVGHVLIQTEYALALSRQSNSNIAPVVRVLHPHTIEARG